MPNQVDQARVAAETALADAEKARRACSEAQIHANVTRYAARTLARAYYVAAGREVKRLERLVDINRSWNEDMQEKHPDGPGDYEKLAPAYEAAIKAEAEARAYYDRVRATVPHW